MFSPRRLHELSGLAPELASARHPTSSLLSSASAPSLDRGQKKSAGSLEEKLPERFRIETRIPGHPLEPPRLEPFEEFAG
jgi:hypothetical protein